MNNEIRRSIKDEGQFTETDYPFQIKPNFSTFGSNIEKIPQRPIISFVFNDSIRNFLGFHETIIFKQYNLSPNFFDILSFENIFLETNISQGLVLKGERSRIIHNFTMDVDSGQI